MIIDIDMASLPLYLLKNVPAHPCSLLGLCGIQAPSMVVLESIALLRALSPGLFSLVYSLLFDFYKEALLLDIRSSCRFSYGMEAM